MAEIGMDYSRGGSVSGLSVGRGPSSPAGGYGDILKAFGSSGGGSGGMRSIDTGSDEYAKQTAQRTADYYKAKPGLEMPASTKAYLDKMGMGSNGNSSGSGPSGGASAGGTTNTSTANPGIGWANDKLKGLYEGGGNVEALSRQAAGSIRDDAENLRKGARDSAAMRGVSGGGVEGIANSAIDREVLQAQGKARVGIANDWEARKQGILRDVAGNSATDENLQNQQRNTGINQASLDFQRANAARQAERDEFKDIFNLFGSFGLLGDA